MVRIPALCSSDHHLKNRSINEKKMDDKLFGQKYLFHSIEFLYFLISTKASLFKLFHFFDCSTVFVVLGHSYAIAVRISFQAINFSSFVTVRLNAPVGDKLPNILGVNRDRH